ncbi:hypothetical protein A2U01_0028152, partial [Trifolium medium]|nr:hypothetical protein [Trifolium medium]
GDVKELSDKEGGGFNP